MTRYFSLPNYNSRMMHFSAHQVLIFFITFSFIIVILSLHSCTEESFNTCYSFDERQCASDPWRTAVPDQVDDSLGDLIELYFMANDIELTTIIIDESFHEVSCLACSCPSSTRIYISVSPLDKEKVGVLDLLSLTEIDCEGI